MKFVKKNIYAILLGAILLFGVYLRFVNTPARYGFDPDATRDAIVSLYGARHFVFPETGPHSSLGLIRFGPWYYYELITASILIPSTNAPWIFMSLVSLAVIMVSYFTGKLLESRLFGLILAGLVSVSPSQIEPALGLSNANLVIIHSSLAILLFVYILKKNPKWWWALLLGFDLGLGINAHFQMLTYLIFIPFLFFAKKNKLSYFFSAIIGILLTFIPLTAFDISHNFMLTRGAFVVSHGETINKLATNWRIYLLSFWPPYWSYIFAASKFITFGIVIGVVTVIVNLYILIRKKFDRIYILLLLAFFAMVFAMRYYPGELSSYYLFFFPPLILIFASEVFYLPFKLKKSKYFKYLSIICYVTFVGWMVYVTLPNYHSYDTRDNAYRRVNRIISTYPDDKITLYSCNGLGDYKTKAVMFILWNMNKLGNGKTIGMPIDDCNKKMTFRSGQIGDELTDLTSLSKKQLKDDGWILVTPETAYNYHAFWYKRNEK